jgi:hypothetical protein
MDIDALLRRAEGADWLTLVNGDLYVGDEWRQWWSKHGAAYIVLSRPEYMKNLFPEAEILPPATPERHHCCVIRALRGSSGR